MITYVLKTLNHGSWFHLPKVRTMGPVSAHLPSSTRNSSRSTCGLPSGFPISRNGCPSHSAAQASIRGAGNSHLSHLAHLRWLFSGHNYYLQVSLHPEVSTNWGNFLYLCTSVLSFNPQSGAHSPHFADGLLRKVRTRQWSSIAPECPPSGPRLAIAVWTGGLAALGARHLEGELDNEQGA